MSAAFSSSAKADQRLAERASLHKATAFAEGARRREQQLQLAAALGVVLGRVEVGHAGRRGLLGEAECQLVGELEAPVVVSARRAELPRAEAERRERKGRVACLPGFHCVGRSDGRSHAGRLHHPAVMLPIGASSE